MTLNELKSMLQRHAEKELKLLLPSGSPVPVSFHITEVGHVAKNFVDCGGRAHASSTCQLQAWVGADEDHRLPAGKLASILEKAEAFLPDREVPVEIEYEDTLISQYPVDDYEVDGGAVILRLSAKHTDCLAKDICLAPRAGGDVLPADLAPGCGCARGQCC